jgi:hypothetical protein
MARPGYPVHYEAEIAQASEWGWALKGKWRDKVRVYVDWFNGGAP